MFIDRYSQQFFSSDHHAIFHKKHHRSINPIISKARTDVRKKIIELHNRMYSRFQAYNIIDLHSPKRKQERTSKHYPNSYNDKTINAIWLHYGKSAQSLSKYTKKEQKSFINHARIQVIIHDVGIGTWLVLGKNWGSDHFKTQISDQNIQKEFLKNLKMLDKEYWIRYDEGKGEKISNITTVKDLQNIVSRESLSEYFIIGRDFNADDYKIFDVNIADTVLEQFSLLYQ